MRNRCQIMGVCILLFFCFDVGFALQPRFPSDEGFYRVQTLPEQAQPILPLTVLEARVVFLEMQAHGVAEGVRLLSGEWVDPAGARVQLYAGDFDNQGHLEYLMVTEGGSLNVDTLSVYQEAPLEARWTRLPLDEAIRQDRLSGQDLSHFYLYTAAVPAIVMAGKTYLRFLAYPSLSNGFTWQLCTYLWQGQHFYLTGPNLSFASKSGTLQETSTCL